MSSPHSHLHVGRRSQEGGVGLDNEVYRCREEVHAVQSRPARSLGHDFLVGRVSADTTETTFTSSEDTGRAGVGWVNKPKKYGFTKVFHTLHTYVDQQNPESIIAVIVSCTGCVYRRTGPTYETCSISCR